jgi:hypothetical protein
MSIDWFIAGTQKSGTTTLKNLLDYSPDILTHLNEECTLFYDYSLHEIDNDKFKRYFYRKKNSKIILAKHANACYSQEELIKLYHHNPDMKIFLLFRNPIKRFISSFMMEKTRSLYKGDIEYAFNKALNDRSSFEYKVFLSYGFYDKVLKKVSGIFPEKNITCLIFEDFKHNPLYTVNEILSNHGMKTIEIDNPDELIHNPVKSPRSRTLVNLFLKLRTSRYKDWIKKYLPPEIWDKLVLQTKNTLFKDFDEPLPTVSLSIIENLLDIYAPVIENFEKMTGLTTHWIEEIEIMTNHEG